jgi:hypothetical protein
MSYVNDSFCLVRANVCAGPPGLLARGALTPQTIGPRPPP